jgi:hypothetical protein
MPTTDKNKSGRHSHPQKDNTNQNERGDSRKNASADAKDLGKKGNGPKQSFGSSGAKDSH